MRIATSADLPLLFELAETQYQNSTFDLQTTKDWFKKTVHDMYVGSDSGLVVVVSDDAGAVFGGQTMFFRPDWKQANVMFLAARKSAPMSGLKLLKNVIEHCKQVGFDEVIFSESTGVSFDVLAKRVGAVSRSRSFGVTLR
jgi:hypothetical protein